MVIKEIIGSTEGDVDAGLDPETFRVDAGCEEGLFDTDWIPAESLPGWIESVKDASKKLFDLMSDSPVSVRLLMDDGTLV